MTWLTCSLRDWGKHSFHVCNALSIIFYLQTCSDAPCLQRVQYCVLEAENTPHCWQPKCLSLNRTGVGRLASYAMDSMRLNPQTPASLKIKLSRKDICEKLNKFSRTQNCSQLLNTGEETSGLKKEKKIPSIKPLNNHLWLMRCKTLNIWSGFTFLLSHWYRHICNHVYLFSTVMLLLTSI